MRPPVTINVSTPAANRQHPISLYWFTGTAGSSANLYYETLHIRRWAEAENHIVHWSEFDRGGHFAALEVPDLLVDDLGKFFRELDWRRRGMLRTVPILSEAGRDEAKPRVYGATDAPRCNP